MLVAVVVAVVFESEELPKADWFAFLPAIFRGGALPLRSVFAKLPPPAEPGCFCVGWRQWLGLMGSKSGLLSVFASFASYVLCSVDSFEPAAAAAPCCIFRLLRTPLLRCIDELVTMAGSPYV